MKKIAIFVISLLALSILLTGCGEKAGQAAGGQGQGQGAAHANANAVALLANYDNAKQELLAKKELRDASFAEELAAYNDFMAKNNDLKMEIESLDAEISAEKVTLLKSKIAEIDAQAKLYQDKRVALKNIENDLQIKEAAYRQSADGILATMR